MFACYEKAPGTRFPKVIALLMLAFLFTPVVLFASGPLSSAGTVLAIVFSCVCAGAAWINWMNYSRMTAMPSIPARLAKVRS